MKKYLSSLRLSVRINSVSEVTDTVCNLQTHIFTHMPKFFTCEPHRSLCSTSMTPGNGKWSTKYKVCASFVERAQCSYLSSKLVFTTQFSCLRGSLSSYNPRLLRHCNNSVTTPCLCEVFAAVWLGTLRYSGIWHRVTVPSSSVV